MKAITFRKYVKEVLKNAVYEKGESSHVIIVAPEINLYPL